MRAVRFIAHRAKAKPLCQMESSMAEPIRYCNTDLDLRSRDDLRPLVRTLQRLGLDVLHVRKADDAQWWATLEADTVGRSPNRHAITMLSAVEKLKPSVRAAWDRCVLREFNIGYDCGDRPWAFNQGLSRRTLQRMADAGLSLRITLYPADPPNQAKLCTS